MTDFGTKLRTLAGSLRATNAGEFVTRGEVAGFFELLADTIRREIPIPGLTDEEIKAIEETSGGLISSQSLNDDDEGNTVPA